MLQPVYFRPRQPPNYAEFFADFMMKDRNVDREFAKKILQQFPKTKTMPDATKGLPIKWPDHFITILSTDPEAYLMINSERVDIGTGSFTLPCRKWQVTLIIIFFTKVS